MGVQTSLEKELIKNSEDLAPVYLLYGAEEFLLQEALQELINKALGDESMSYFRFFGEENVLPAALLEAETFPFFSKRKVVVLQEALFLTTKGKTDQTELLEKYLENPSPFTVLFLTVSSDKLDDRKKIVKQVKQSATLLSFMTLKEQESKEWIRKRAKLKGLELTKAAVDRLFLVVGSDLRSLDGELEKFSLYLLSTKTGKAGQIVEENLVNLLSSKTKQNTVFVFVDDVIRKKTSDALEVLIELQKAKEPAVYLVIMLARQFRIALQVKTQLQKGYSSQQISQSLGIHPYATKLAGEQGDKYTIEELQNILVRLADIDFGLKSGKIRDVDSVREFVLWLAVSSHEKQGMRVSYL